MSHHRSIQLINSLKNPNTVHRLSVVLEDTINTKQVHILLTSNVFVRRGSQNQQWTTTHLPGVGHVSANLGAIVHGRNQETIERRQQDQREEVE